MLNILADEQIAVTDFDDLLRELLSPRIKLNANDGNRNVTAPRHRNRIKHITLRVFSNRGKGVRNKHDVPRHVRIGKELYAFVKRLRDICLARSPDFRDMA